VKRSKGDSLSFLLGVLLTMRSRNYKVDVVVRIMHVHTLEIPPPRHISSVYQTFRPSLVGHGFVSKLFVEI